MNFLTTAQKSLLTRLGLHSLCAALILSTAVSCKKENDVEPNQGKVVFWTQNSAVTKIKVDCYVDGELIGTLSKISSSKPSCDAAGLPIAKVDAGEHVLEFRAANGQSFEESFEVEAGKCTDFELY
ncbi:hypothetical protein [Larkinella soli]|uniref:hypothetical protein n=1 Tax=Larkinella soli TaxID=1770527 RepID=UPI000FFC0509|nr:hypothetical protein [Larkinella soli]